MESIEEFENDSPLEAKGVASFVVDIDGFEGPIDVLLALARDQKVDITQISILQLADQYLEFVTIASHNNLELAADYLVMAAWLAYLKSRLLLPDLGAEDEPTGEEMALALAFQLKRLESMQQAGAALMAMDKLGQDFFARGIPEKFKISHSTVFDVSLIDMLKAYGSQSNAKVDRTLHIEAWDLHSVDDALERLLQVVGKMPDWNVLSTFLPAGLKEGLTFRSAVASTFAATLEMAREGKLRLRQNAAFEPIFVRSAPDDLTTRPTELIEAAMSDTDEEE
ncbi:MAG: segregation/condensation protein A [Rhodospirillaceae bacterium]|nr:segregation/condensation protein A [Rhodospirillaceae bacterium]MBL6930982.1 segregation/condensation protein A [Rhodospirillales bacterium]MBL6941911.1 segregation/condensation protein A [Rhodospirillales bacterium]